jgi:peptide/nickel transport system substrate-binding protein
VGARATLLASLLTVVAAAGTACAPPRQSAEAGVLVITESEQTASFIRNFNPLLEVGDVRWPAKRSMYEPLGILNLAKGEHTPWLATGWHWSADHLKLTFDIRAGVKWSDGHAFAASDVVYSFAILKQHAALDLRGVWRFVSDVKAVGETVEFTFHRPYVPGLHYVLQQPIVPEHIWKDIADPVTWTNPNPVATGPFTQVAWFRPQAYQIDKNPHYWQAGKPAVKSLRFIALPANDVTVLAMVNDEVDWAGNFVPAVDRVYVGANPDHHHYWYPLLDGMVMLYANTTMKPYDDVRVRKALSMALDRELMVEVAMHGYTRPAEANAFSDAYKKWRSEKAIAKGGWVKLDRPGAEALLDEAGLKKGKDGLRRLADGKAWKVEIIVPSGWSDWLRAAQVCARSLRAVGIDAQLRAYDFNAWYEKVQQGEFALGLGWTENGPTPYGLYRSLMSSRTRMPIGETGVENWHRFSIDAADELLTKLEDTTDPAEEYRLIEELQLLFVENAPAIPLFPGPLWGQFSDARFVGFPSAENPYATLSPHMYPQTFLVLPELTPR